MAAYIRNGVGGVVFVLLAFLFFATPAWAQNLTIGKTASPEPVQVGANLTYTIQVANPAGQPNPLAVTVTDTLPSGVNVVGFLPGQDQTCQLNPANSSQVICNFGTLPNGTSESVQIIVTPQNTGSKTNSAQITAGDSDFSTATVTSTVQPRSKNGNGNGKGKGKNNRVIIIDDNNNNDDDDGDLDNDGDIDQDDELLDAENDLNDEDTDGEDTIGDTFDDEFDDNGDDNGVSATSGDGVAEASTPNASASAGDPDELEPLTSVPDDVEDEIPTSGPLPNTSGSLWVYVMPGLGCLLLLALLIRRMWRADY